jgi:predicted metal-dependent hydrolase
LDVICLNNYVLKNDKDSTSIPYVLVRKNSRSIKIKIDINGMIVFAPVYIGQDKIEEVIIKKKEWIFKHYKSIQDIHMKVENRKFEKGEDVIYLGEQYPIKVFKSENLQNKVVFNKKYFQIYLAKNLSDDLVKYNIEASLKLWFKKEATILIAQRLQYYSIIIGVKYNEVRIKEQKSLWGSCSKMNNLNFNLKLTMAPMWVLDYVIVHELCHLKFFNHSKEFWGMVNNYYPKWIEAKNWLKENGLYLKF